MFSPLVLSSVSVMFLRPLRRSLARSTCQRNASRSQGYSSHPSPPSEREACYFLTTPIFYVNGPPHLGHLYTALLADAQAR